MATGYLIFQARTAHDALPLQGVRVSIMDGEGRRLYEMTTDENGQTQAAALETVNKSYSLSP